jgi:predicted phage baseplate assembly protein
VTERDLVTICECCTGVERLVPSLQFNRPGLSTLSWRVGTHARFKATMVADISRKARLQDLGRRTNDDFTIALIDAWAVSLDVLAFYQERILNEAFLRTAVERGSLLDLARLIGYELRPGLAAGVLLAFLLDTSPGSPREVAIAIGTGAQSIPIKEETPQTFETIEDLVAKPRWNELRPRLSFPQVFDESTRSFFVKGTAANLKPGDPMLLVTGDGGTSQTFLRVQTVQLEPQKGRTLVTLQLNPPAMQGYELPIKTFGQFGDASFGGVTESLQSETFSSSDLQTVLLTQGESIDQLIDVLTAYRALPPEAPQPGDPGLYALRASAAPFGHNAPLYRSTPGEWRGDNGPYPNNWDRPSGWPITLDSGNDDHGDGRTILTDQEVKGIVDDDWVVLVSRTEGARVYQVETVSTQSVADFGMSGKASRVVLKLAPGGADPTSAIDDYRIRETTIHTVSQILELAELPIDTLDAGALTIELENIVPDLTTDRRLILTGQRIGDFEGVAGAEELELASVGQGVFTTLFLAGPIASSYKRDTVRIFANVAPATHGDSRAEVLGSGDGSQSFQVFLPKQNPITHVSSALSPTGGASTLEVRVNGVRWHEAPSFYPLAPDDHSYVVRRNDAGRTEVHFGDGLRGARLPTGVENITARYRSGLGAAGLVGENRITLLPRKPLGVRSVTNPIASSGAQDAETRDAARDNAPFTVRTLDRVVSLTDFEDFARTFSGIGKARADWVWAGSQRLVHVTVAGPDGAPVSPTVLENLIAAIDAARVPHQPARISPFAPLFFTLTASLAIEPDYEQDSVIAAAEAALRDAFSFAARPFADRVAASEVIALLERVAGVDGVDLDALSYDVTSGGNIADQFGLPSLGARFDQATGAILPAQLLMITPGPLDLRVLS